MPQMKCLLVLPVLALLSAAAPPHRPATRPASFRLSAPFPTGLLSLSSIGLLADPSGYIVVGYNESTAVRRRSVGIVVANSAGKQLWSRTYGARRAVRDLQALRTSDGGLLVWGQEEPAGPGHSYPYLLRIGPKGESLWSRAYGGCHRPARAIEQTPDGGFIIAGAASGTYLLKVNARGDTLWRKSYDGTDAHSMQQTADGGYITTGVRIGDVYLARTDGNGNALWSRSYGAPGIDYDDGYSVQQTRDGGFVVAGLFGGRGPGYQAYMVRTNGNGDSIWTRTYGGEGTQSGKWVRQTADGGFMMVGSDIRTTSGMLTQGDVKAYVVRTDADGDTLWTRTLNDTLNYGHWSVFRTADDGLALASLDLRELLNQLLCADPSKPAPEGVRIMLITIDAAGHVARPK